MSKFGLRFTFIRPADLGSESAVDASEPTAEIAAFESKMCATPRPEAPSPPAKLSRQQARVYLSRALAAARRGGGDAATLDSVVDVVAHASKYGAVKQILIEAGIAETLISFLKDALGRFDEPMMLRIVAAIQLLLQVSAQPTIAAVRVEENFAMHCLECDLCAYVSSLIERYIDSAVMLAALSNLLKLLLRTGLRARKVVLGSGIIRFVTNQILSNTSHIDGIIILSDALKSMMDYSAGYRRDHSVAIRDAAAAVEIYSDNIHVARIACILLSQRKWSRPENNSAPMPIVEAVELLMRCMLQWRRDECVVRCAMLAIRSAVVSVGRADAQRALVYRLLAHEVLEACIQFLYVFRKKNSALVEIINFTSLLDSAVSKRGGGALHDCAALSWQCEADLRLVVSTKMRLNELSMNYRWEMRRGLCLFLSQHGYVRRPLRDGQLPPSPRHTQSAERPRPCSPDTDTSSRSSDSSKAAMATAGAPAYSKLPLYMDAVFRSREICISIASFM